MSGLNTFEVERKVVKATSDMEVNHFCIDASRDEMSVSQFMDRLDVFKFNDPIQRNADAWNLTKKSLLIVSVLEEVSIGEIKVQIIRKSGKKYRNVLDGKQRLTTIRDFIRNKFALVNAFVLSFDKDGAEIFIDISDMFFKDLPKAYQDRIKALVLDIKAYEIDDKLKAELFHRWNNGEALTPAEKRKAKMSDELLFALAEMKSYKMFQSGFKPSTIKRDGDQTILLQAMAVLLTDNNTSTNTTKIDSMIEKNEFITAVLSEMKSLIQYIGEAQDFLEQKEIENAFNKTKVVSLFYVSRFAKREGRSADEFATWMKQFFTKDYSKSGYSMYAKASTAVPENVKKRNNIMLDHYRDFFSKTA